jgi:hypothetical protein
MIVQPHFLDHWKTNALGAAIGRLEAITALLSLWAHCQNQRCWQFPKNELMLAGICRFSGNPRVLVDTLLQLNLLEMVDENTVEVHEWAETNAKLLHNWEAGKKGGRPRKQPKAKPTENPRVNPSQTQGEPEGEPIREDKIRSTPFIPQGEDLALDANANQQIESTASASGEAKLSAPRKKKARGAGLKEAAAIYEGYPRKIGRDAALRAIQRRLDQGLTVEALREAVQRYAAATARWPADERQFIPHPATWFNRGSFADDPQEWQRAETGGVSANKKEGGAAPRIDVQEGAPTVPAPPQGLERAMLALYGEGWEDWAPSWYAMTWSARSNILKFLNETP